MSSPSDRNPLTESVPGSLPASGTEDRQNSASSADRDIEIHGVESISASNPGRNPTSGAIATFEANPARINAQEKGDDPGKAFADHRYRVIGLHARGGIGQVLLAVDSDLSREVALKEILPSLADDEASRRRFLLEAEITGRLEHPGVVPVYAMGKSADDRPFYVMRFIRGESLKEAIDRFHGGTDKSGKAAKFRTLPFRQLLRRFVDICNTMAYAHSRGVLHRDLKPSNVMLGTYGETLVVDWGLAKVVGRQDPEIAGEATLRPQSGSGSSETQAGIAIGTPAYMSPEQAEGRLDAIGPASDIYSLGATLFAILTGKPPFAESTLDLLLARVRSGDFQPPRELEGDVPRALDAICTKAMALSPARRYDSAGQLAQEIEHWLADEPVDCYREPLLARLSRWGRHHKTGVAATGIFLVMTTLMLGAGTIVLTQVNSRIEEERRLADAQREIAQRQRDLARENFDKAREAVTSYLTLVKDEPVLNRPGLEPVRQTLLRSAMPYFEDFIEQRGDDPTLRLELAEAYRLSGEITGQIDSRVHAQEKLGQAIRLYDEYLRESPNSAEARSGLGRALLALSYFQIFGDAIDEGAVTVNRAIQVNEALRDSNPEIAEFHRMVGRSYDLRGMSLGFAGNTESGLKDTLIALRLLEETVRKFPRDSEAKRMLARAYNNRSAMAMQSGKFEDCLIALETAASKYRELIVAEPTDIAAEIGFVRVLVNSGRLELMLGRYADGQKPLEEGLVRIEKLLASSPEMNEYLGLFIDCTDRLALALAECGKTTRARELVKRCLEKEPLFARKGAINDDVRETFADVWWTLFLVESRDGNETAADAAYKKAETYFETLLSSKTDHNYASQRSALLEDRIRLRPIPPEPERIKARVSQIQAIIADRKSRLAAGSDPESRRTELARGLVTLSETLMARDAAAFDPAPLNQALQSLDQVIGRRPDSLEIRRIQIRALTIQAHYQQAKSDSDAARRSIGQSLDLAARASNEDPAYLYDLVCTHAAASKILAVSHPAEAGQHREKAVATIRKAIDSGFDDLPRLSVDPDLAPIRDAPSFRELLR